MYYLSFFLYKLHVFCGLHLFAEYYISFCNYYIFGVSSVRFHAQLVEHVLPKQVISLGFIFSCDIPKSVIQFV